MAGLNETGLPHVAPGPLYSFAGRVGIGQARRWSTLTELSRLKQSKFTT